MKWYVGGIIVALIASLVGLGLIIVQTDPASAQTSIKTLFFLALFVSLWSLATIVEFAIRRRSRPAGAWAEAVFRSSFLHAFCLSCLVIALLLAKKFFS